MKKFVNFFTRLSFSKAAPGIFEIPGLFKASDIAAFEKSTFDKCENLRGDIIQSEVTEIGDVLFALDHMDELSNQLCIFLDSMNCMRHLFESPMREEADYYFQNGLAYMHELNNDVEMYSVMARLYETVDVELLTPSQLKLLETIVDDLELRSGAAQGKEEEIMALNLELDALENTMGKEIEKFYLSMQMKNVTKLGVSMESDSKKRFKKVKKRNEEARGVQEICVEVLNKRNEIAKMMGSESGAHAALSTNGILNTPEMVMSFLQKYHASLVESTTEDIDILKEYGGIDVLHEWDWRALRRNFLKDNSNAMPKQPVSVFRCLEVLATLCERTFGLKLVPSKDVGVDELWHNDVMKYDVLDEKCEKMGSIYFDLFRRSGKQVKFSTIYTVRGGKSLTNQTPLCVISCEIQRDRMTWNNVRSIFHEFGHALHMIIGTTEYQNFTGNRCCADVVELPSQIFSSFVDCIEIAEMMVDDPNVEFKSSFEKAIEEREMFSSLDNTLQVMNSMLDIQLNQCPPADVVGLQSDFGKIIEHYGPIGIQFLEGGFPNYIFEHLLHYRSSFFSYTFNEVLADVIFKECGFSSDPFNRKGGETLLKLLSAGGSIDSKNMVCKVISEKDLESLWDEI